MKVMYNFSIKRPNTLLWIFSILFILNLDAFSQGVGKSNNPAYKPYFDSLKKMDYPYALPILGKQAYKRGYDISYAYGISGVYFTQTQEISIESTSIGINGSEQVDLSNVIDFGPTIATTNAYTVRPDIWLLPFLNLYGILGGGTTETRVNLLAPVGLETTQRFEARSFGLGATLAGAVGPVWIAWDNNYNFVDVDVIVEPIPAFNSSIRFGHTLRNPTYPQKSLAVWVGVFYQKLSNDTRGSIGVTEIFPGFGSGNFIGTLRDWSETLPPAQRLVVNQIINELENVSNNIDSDGTIDYTLEKRVTAPFNIILGSQYQFNKRWILRTELGVFGKRSQFMLNLNYRIPGFRKTTK
ncbi:hypothetical protein [Echinicola arenosa]|uniref:hypothetical protein n=1 Tax=Echinicola arenosa TaxID=2774144 RepID=UPI001CDC82CE|nr:hypothetical protein [Echinicola arenosa]